VSIGQTEEKKVSWEEVVWVILSLRSPHHFFRRPHMAGRATLNRRELAYWKAAPYKGELMPDILRWPRWRYNTWFDTALPSHQEIFYFAAFFRYHGVSARIFYNVMWARWYNHPRVTSGDSNFHYDLFTKMMEYNKIEVRNMDPSVYELRRYPRRFDDDGNELTQAQYWKWRRRKALEKA